MTAETNGMTLIEYICSSGLTSPEKSATFVLQGGYFSSTTGIDAFSRNTLREVISLKEKLLSIHKKNRVHIALLINDIGDLECGGDSCTIAVSRSGASREQMVQDAERLLRQHGVADFKIFTERNLRNRGLKRLKKLRVNGVFPPHVVSRGIRGGAVDHVFEAEGDEIALFREFGASWAAKCPVIMASFNSAAVDWAYGLSPASRHIAVVDFATWSDRDKVHKGATVARHLLPPRFAEQVPYSLVPVLSDTECNRIWSPRIYSNDPNIQNRPLLVPSTLSGAQVEDQSAVDGSTSEDHFIYLDYQATTPVDQTVIDAMMPYFKQTFANPGSPHIMGIESEEGVASCRQRVAACFGQAAHNVVFTGSASEANNLIILGRAAATNRGHLITSQIEHKSVLEPCRKLDEEGFDLTYLGVDSQGQINPDALKAALRPDTRLVSIMYANNEIGTIQPMAEVSRICRDAGVLLHCDATQGALYADQKRLGELADIVTISAHKLYGPKGVGAIVAKDGALAQLKPIVFGGGQERGLRAGTANLPGIVGLARALEIADTTREDACDRMRQFRQRFIDRLSKQIAFRINGNLNTSVPHAVSIAIEGVEGQDVLSRLGSLGVSTGSACNSKSNSSSYVLNAIGLEPRLQRSTLRISFGRETREQDPILAADRIGAAVCDVMGASRTMATV